MKNNVKVLTLHELKAVVPLGKQTRSKPVATPQVGSKFWSLEFALSLLWVCSWSLGRPGFARGLPGVCPTRFGRRQILCMHKNFELPILVSRVCLGFALGLHRVCPGSPGVCSPFFWSPGVCLCLLYTSPSPRDRQKSRMPSSA